jgi:hypothetical protein
MTCLQNGERAVNYRPNSVVEAAVTAAETKHETFKNSMPKRATKIIIGKTKLEKNG